MNAHQVTRDFEKALADYTEAPYVVCVNSCTMALLLAVAWQIEFGRAIHPLEGAYEPGTNRPRIQIPKRTYVGVPMSIIHAGGWPTFREEYWEGAYQLKPLPVWDSARYLTGGLYKGMRRIKVAHSAPGEQSITTVDIQRDCSGQMVCISFHATKTLGIEQGGAILLDDPEADDWLRRARFDGRRAGVSPRDQKPEDWMVGWHCYMNPSTAAQGLMKMAALKMHNEPLPNDDYPDLSQMEIFR